MRPAFTAVRRPHLSPVAVDRLVAAVLTVTAQLEVWLGNGNHADHNQWVASAVSLLATLSVAVRRRWPLQVGVAVGWAFAVQLGFWGDPQILSASVAWFCALYALTAWTSTRDFVLGTALLVPAFVVTAVGPKGSVGSTVLFTLVALIVMLLVRRVLGDRERRLRLAERERDLAAREAVVEERARIARELHDAIAHDVSLMVVQAGAERRTLDDQSPTKEVLETVERIGRGALTEMRRLVGMLRSSDSAEPLAPQPGLHDLQTLVTQVRAAGLPVEVTVEGEPRELPVGLELSAYRIVQEVLTNALKYAGEARATVHVRYAADSLELEIADGGGGAIEPATSGGHGLVGMRERVALYGGRFEASRRATGGFAVRVALPIR